MNHEGVCRTAPATPGLSISAKQYTFCVRLYLFALRSLLHDFSRCNAVAEFDNTSVKIVDNPAKGNNLIFKCDQCAYTNLTEKGLGQHTRMKHRISQLDGNFDLVEDDSKSESKVEPCPFCSEDELAKFCQCRNYEECECMVTQRSMNIHIINAHEPKLIWAHFGKEWVMNNKEWIQNRQWNQTWRSLNVL